MIITIKITIPNHWGFPRFIVPAPLQGIENNFMLWNFWTDCTWKNQKVFVFVFKWMTSRYLFIIRTFKYLTVLTYILNEFCTPTFEVCTYIIVWIFKYFFKFQVFVQHWREIILRDVGSKKKRLTELVRLR